MRRLKALLAGVSSIALGCFCPFEAPALAANPTYFPILPNCTTFLHGNGALASTCDVAGCRSALEFGFVGDGVTDNKTAWTTAKAAMPNGACLHFPTGKYLTSVSETWAMPSAQAGFRLEGDGTESSILYWPNTSGGLTLTENSCMNSFHLDGLSFTTGVASGGTAFNVNQTTANCEGTHYATSDIYRTTFRGDDGGNGTDYWGYGVTLSGVWSTNFDGDTWYGPTATLGYGVFLTSADSSHVTAIANFAKCWFGYEGIGIVYGNLVEGVTVDQTNFNDDTTGIQSPASETALSQLAITNSQFNTTSIAVNLLSTVYNVAVMNSEFIVANGSQGINFATPDGYQIVGNFFSGGAYGVVVGSELGVNGGGILADNVFYSEGLGINLQSGANYNIVQGNNFVSDTATITNNGSYNQISSNQGYNPVGASTVTPGASPWTYTAGASPETLYIGTSSAITALTQNGTSILLPLTVTQDSIDLGPGDVLVVTYTGTLVAKKMIH